MLKDLSIIFKSFKGNTEGDHAQLDQGFNTISRTGIPGLTGSFMNVYYRGQDGRRIPNSRLDEKGNRVCYRQITCSVSTTTTNSEKVYFTPLIWTDSIARRLKDSHSSRTHHLSFGWEVAS